jgi:hypothetical protein
MEKAYPAGAGEIRTSQAIAAAPSSAEVGS